MAKRMSSRERIERLAAEKEASEKEKAEQKEKTKAKKKKKKTPARRKKVGAAPKREKTVWKVFNSNYKEVACYPYPENAKAEAHAAKLTKKSGNPHFVNSAKVPMDDDN